MRLHFIDWAVLGGYLLAVMAIGLWAGRAPKSPDCERRLQGEIDADAAGEDDYFLGGRRVPVWAVAMSVLATALSAATFIGAPADAYAGDLSYLILTLGGVLGAVVAATLFIPVFHRGGTLTIYGYLGHRYGQGSAAAGGVAFLAGRLLASGARLFAAGLAFALLLGEPDSLPATLLAIVGLGVLGTLYTAVGGIRAVIWTDVMQIVVVVGVAMVTAVILLWQIGMTPAELWATLRRPPDGSPSKLTLGSLSSDPAAPYTLWTALAMTLFNAAAYGTDQDLAQRLLTTKSPARGSLSLIAAIVAGIPVTAVFMLLGLLLWVYYVVQGHGGGGPERAVDVYPMFLLTGLPAGVKGLAVAGLLAAAMSSLDSAINAMASSALADVWRPYQTLRDQTLRSRSRSASASAWERGSGWVGARVGARGMVVAMGGALTAAACGLAVMYDRSDQSLLSFALGVMTFAYAGLLGVFLTARLTRRGSTASVVAALLAGGAVVAACYWMPLWSVRWVGVEWKLAFAWWMVVGTAVSFVVCITGRSKARELGTETGADTGHAGGRGG